MAQKVYSPERPPLCVHVSILANIGVLRIVFVCAMRLIFVLSS